MKNAQFKSALMDILSGTISLVGLILATSIPLLMLTALLAILAKLGAYTVQIFYNLL